MLEHIYLYMAVVLCFSMTWGVGANDLANVMSATMGSKAISVRQAMIIAIIFEFLGAFLGGQGVTETMRDGIIDISLLNNNPKLLIEGMLAILLACTIWMNLASLLGLPVSITNAIVGSMVGFGATIFSFNSIHWHQVGYIVISWVVSPFIAGISGYLLISSIQRLILGRPDPIKQSRRYLPIYLFLVGLVLSFITIFKMIGHFGIHLGFVNGLLLILTSSTLLTLFGLWYLNTKPKKSIKKRRLRFNFVEDQFAFLVALTTCMMVFAHGANDVSLAVSPLSLIVSLSRHGLEFNADSFPAWITLLGCVGVVLGLIFYGKKVIETVGSSITALTPSRAYAATLAAATTVIISTNTGIPVSATQTLVGAVLGVGLARGIGALNLIVIRNIFMSWVFTLPASSLLTVGCYYLIHFMFK